MRLGVNGPVGAGKGKSIRDWVEEGGTKLGKRKGCRCQSRRLGVVGFGQKGRRRPWWVGGLRVAITWERVSLGVDRMERLSSCPPPDPIYSGVIPDLKFHNKNHKDTWISPTYLQLCTDKTRLGITTACSCVLDLLWDSEIVISAYFQPSPD